MNLEWMAWTVPTATFFITIVLTLTCMTIWEVYSPTTDRRGFLPLSTTRGDRLFIGLLSNAYINLAWLGLTDITIWVSFVLGLIWMGIVMRWG
jgi:predicted small integral membrane protein